MVPNKERTMLNAYDVPRVASHAERQAEISDVYENRCICTGFACDTGEPVWAPQDSGSPG